MQIGIGAETGTRAKPARAKAQRELFREQQQWLRDRATEAAAQVQSKGGSLAALEYSGAFSDFTKKRIAELRRRMSHHNSKPQ